MGVYNSCVKSFDEVPNTKQLQKRTFTLTPNNFYEHNYMYQKKENSLNYERERVILTVVDNNF